MITLYQRYISPLLPPHCRYQPTCSAYMSEAIIEHGVWRGLRLGVTRLMRCHPFGASGYDPVPSPSRGESNGG